MWDIGFCTGSVSIEAKLQFPQLDIIAFERREESRKLLEDNCRKFGAPGIEGVIADFMEYDLSQYPRPDAVFIGGHGGKLGEMIKRVYDYINPGGVIVFNSVSAESCKEFKDTINKYGQIVSEHVLTLDEHNPITIIKAI
jgi:precorrin-6Y C5,15-methyltransferase (decarboxylating)